MRGVQYLCFFKRAKVTGGGAKEDFRNREMDLVAIHGKGDLNLEGNNRR